jgi:lipoate-protein ligase A
MSSEVETPVDISASRPIQRALACARTDKGADVRRSFFPSLGVYRDVAQHSAAMNMGIVEALLESATVPLIRFYRWHSPALSFGYFGKYSDVAIHAQERDLVRRWTGGGIVFHGEDLTYSIVLPSADPAFTESSLVIYERAHRALAEALNAIGEHAVVAGPVGPGRITFAQQAALSASGHSCFANPVRADVMVNGRKVAGAAQRRTRRGLLQQGSIQGIPLPNDLDKRFAHALSANCTEFKISEDILRRARELARQKYANDSWLRMR